MNEETTGIGVPATDEEISEMRSRIIEEIPFEAMIPDENGGKRKETWVYKFDLLSPTQYQRAANIWSYANQIIASANSMTFQQAEETGGFDLDREAFKCILVRRREVTTKDEETGEVKTTFVYDEYSHDKRLELYKAAGIAYDNIRGSKQRARLKFAKESFFLINGIPKEERTRNYSMLVASLLDSLSLIQQNGGAPNESSGLQKMNT